MTASWIPPGTDGLLDTSWYRRPPDYGPGTDGLLTTALVPTYTALVPTYTALVPLYTVLGHVPRYPEA